jgi:hypothetical protein
MCRNLQVLLWPIRFIIKMELFLLLQKSFVLYCVKNIPIKLLVSLNEDGEHEDERFYGCAFMRFGSVFSRLYWKLLICCRRNFRPCPEGNFLSVYWVQVIAKSQICETPRQRPGILWICRRLLLSDVGVVDYKNKDLNFIWFSFQPSPRTWEF